MPHTTSKETDLNTGGWFNNQNSSKLCLGLNLTHPRAKEIFDLQVSNLALCLLAGAEVIVAKGGEIEGLPKFLVTALNLVDKGKKKGLFKNLYGGVPEVIKSLPVAPELYKATTNQFKTYQEALNFGKDILKNASTLVKNFINPNPDVRLARLQFAPKMAR